MLLSLFSRAPFLFHAFLFEFTKVTTETFLYMSNIFFPFNIISNIKLGTFFTNWTMTVWTPSSTSVLYNKSLLPLESKKGSAPSTSVSSEDYLWSISQMFSCLLKYSLKTRESTPYFHNKNSDYSFWLVTMTIFYYIFGFMI